MTDHIERLRGLLEKATPGPLILIRYDHGGGRLYQETPRQLVADFFQEPDRELFYAMRNAFPALLAVAEAAKKACADYDKRRSGRNADCPCIYSLEYDLPEALANLKKLP